MRNKLKMLLLALALCGAVMTVPVVTTGCHTTRQRAVYNTLSSLEISVDSAFTGYLDLVVAGKLPTTSVKAISTDYDLFQAAMRVAITQAQGNTNAIAPQSVLDSGAKVLNSIIIVKGAVK